MEVSRRTFPSTRHPRARGMSVLYRADEASGVIVGFAFGCGSAWQILPSVILGFEQVS